MYNNNRKECRRSILRFISIIFFTLTIFAFIGYNSYLFSKTNFISIEIEKLDNAIKAQKKINILIIANATPKMDFSFPLISKAILEFSKTINSNEEGVHCNYFGFYRVFQQEIP